jgi:hypothetical protein
MRVAVSDRGMVTDVRDVGKGRKTFIVQAEILDNPSGLQF